MKRIATLVAGRTQAYLLNYEETLTELFGSSEALGSELRFPLFLSSLTEDAVSAVKQVRSQIPTGILEWIQDFDAEIEPDIAADQRFDFRIYLIPQTGHQARTIIREKHVPVADLGNLRPVQVVERVSAALDRPFNQHLHTQAWKFFKVRPPAGSSDPTATKADRFSVGADLWYKKLIEKIEGGTRAKGTREGYDARYEITYCLR